MEDFNLLFRECCQPGRSVVGKSEGCIFWAKTQWLQCFVAASAQNREGGWCCLRWEFSLILIVFLCHCCLRGVQAEPVHPPTPPSSTFCLSYCTRSPNFSAASPLKEQPQLIDWDLTNGEGESQHNNSFSASVLSFIFFSLHVFFGLRFCRKRFSVKFAPIASHSFFIYFLSPIPPISSYIFISGSC